MRVRVRIAALLVILGACAPPEPPPPPPNPDCVDYLVDAPEVGGDCGDMSGLQWDAPWPMRGQCPSHQGRSAFFGPVHDVNVQFKVEGPGAINGQAAIGSDGTIYFGRDEVRAVKPTGDHVWSVPGDHLGFESSPAIGSDGTVYIGNDDTNLYAIRSDGTVRNVFETGWKVVSSPVIAGDGTVYIASDLLYSLTPDLKHVNWARPLGATVHNPAPAIGPDGTIYVVSLEGTLHAFSPMGDELWQFHGKPQAWNSSPAVGADGAIYYGTQYLYAVEPDGSPRWCVPTEGGAFSSSPAIGDDGTIYVGADDFHLYAIAPSGKVKWKFKTGNVVWSSPIVDAGGTIYFGSGDKHVYGVDPEGYETFNAAVDGEVYSSPSLSSDGVLHVGTLAGTLYAFRP